MMSELRPRTRAYHGRIERGDRSLEEFSHEAKQDIHCVLWASPIPPDKRADLMTAWMEIVANCYEHTAAPELCCNLLAGRRVVVLTARYETEPFDTCPPIPDPEELLDHGRGLLLIREMTQSRWQFRGGELIVSLTKQW